MNVNTGELFRLDGETLEKLLRLNGEIHPVPDELLDEVEKELAGKDRTIVDMTKNTPLVKWAKSMRVGRNHPCPCGSGKKYKKCCGK